MRGAGREVPALVLDAPMGRAWRDAYLDVDGLDEPAPFPWAWAWLEALVGCPQPEWCRLLRDWMAFHQLSRGEVARIFGLSFHSIAAKLAGRRPTTVRVISRMAQLDWAIELARLTTEAEAAWKRQDLRALGIWMARIALHRDQGVPGWPPGELPWRPEPNRKVRRQLMRRFGVNVNDELEPAPPWTHGLQPRKRGPPGT